MNTAYEIAMQYRTEDLRQSIRDLMHDFNMQMSDDMRGRINFTTRERMMWYDAYCMLCFAANVKPHDRVTFYEGDFFDPFIEAE